MFRVALRGEQGAGLGDALTLDGAIYAAHVDYVREGDWGNVLRDPPLAVQVDTDQQGAWPETNLARWLTKLPHTPHYGLLLGTVLLLTAQEKWDARQTGGSNEHRSRKGLETARYQLSALVNEVSQLNGDGDRDWDPEVDMVQVLLVAQIAAELAVTLAAVHEARRRVP